MAERLGLPQSVRICAGAGDNAAAAIGTGTVGDAQCNISLGTSGTVFISSESFVSVPNNALHAFAHADGCFHLLGCMLSAASCNKWWMEQILHSHSFTAEQAGIADDMLGNNATYFLPYLMGERSPHNDAAAKGCFIGLSMRTARLDMTQAVFEGVAFAIRDSLEIARDRGIVPKQSRICGGGAKSPLWRKIMSNVINLPLMLPAQEEGSSMGSAILASVACGQYGSVREAVGRIVKMTGSEEPSAEIAQRYEQKYQTFKKLYPALKERFKEL